MLRLKINLRVRRFVRAKCPRHPRNNSKRDGAGAIRGGCRYCVAIYDMSYMWGSLRSSGSSGPCKRCNNKSLDVRCSMRQPRKYIRALLQGAGDFVAHAPVITPKRQQKVAFTIPIESDVKQVIVSGATFRPVPNPGRPGRLA